MGPPTALRRLVLDRDGTILSTNAVRDSIGALQGRRFRRRAIAGCAAGSGRNRSLTGAAIEDYIAKHNENPQSFSWTAKAEAILEKVRRARAVLDKMQTA